MVYFSFVCTTIRFVSSSDMQKDGSIIKVRFNIYLFNLVHSLVRWLNDLTRSPIVVDLYGESFGSPGVGPHL